jgi:hypothetical protein
MKIKELIEELQKLDPELPVYWSDVDYGTQEVELIEVREGRPQHLYRPHETHVHIS